MLLNCIRPVLGMCVTLFSPALSIDPTCCTRTHSRACARIRPSMDEQQTHSTHGMSQVFWGNLDLILSYAVPSVMGLPAMYGLVRLATTLPRIRRLKLVKGTHTLMHIRVHNKSTDDHARACTHARWHACTLACTYAPFVPACMHTHVDACTHAGNSEFVSSTLWQPV